MNFFQTASLINCLIIFSSWFLRSPAAAACGFSGEFDPFLRFCVLVVTTSALIGGVSVLNHITGVLIGYACALLQRL